MKLKEHLVKSGTNPHLITVMCSIADMTKSIAQAIIHQQGRERTSNIHGDEQMALDKWADDFLVKGLHDLRLVKTIASEEQSEIIEIVKAEGEFGVTLDPLDGSSLIDVNLSIGTIVGIFEEGGVLEKGEKLDAAFYVVYGPLTTLVYTVKKGVHEFVLTPKNEFVLRKENMTIPEGKIYAPGGLAKEYLPAHAAYVKALEERGYKLRYSGGMVPDINQILHKGGIFMYPQVKGNENGKLRLLFECNPLSFIITQAGGACSDGKQSILTKKPESIADRTPIYVGSKGAVHLAEEYLSKKQ